MSAVEHQIPPLNIPAGVAAKVRIIDSTSAIKGIAISVLFGPPLEGFTHLAPLPSYSFLIEHPSGRKVLFDLGVRKDWETGFAPHIAKRVPDNGWTCTVEKNVEEILVENDVDLKAIDAIVWSHWHWDHLGDPSKFPPSADLIVGPGFKESFMPGWPTNPESPIVESDYAGRNLVEIDFSTPSTFKIGNFNAQDYFGDGSFYLLDSPGHAVGHISGLARTTTNPDTFIFMGGDVCHHVGEIRPSAYRALPSSISPHPFSTKGSLHSHAPCPGAMFEDLQRKRGRGAGQSFFEATSGADVPETNRTLGKVQEVDANENVFFIMAHDDTLIGTVDFFPKSANEWMEKGWAEKLRWTFLRDFKPAYEGKGENGL